MLAYEENSCCIYGYNDDCIMGCKDESAIYYGNDTWAPYEISHYIYTISRQLILTTVCYSDDNSRLSVSTLSLGQVNSTEFRK